MTHLFELDTLGGSQLQLRVKTPTHENPLTAIHLHALHDHLPPVARRAVQGAGVVGTAAFACIDYRETSTMHYYSQAAQQQALHFNARAVNGPGALREPGQGIFARLDGIQDPAALRFRLHKLAMFKDDDTPGATAITTGCPLRVVLDLLFMHAVPDDDNGGVRVHSLRLDLRSV